MKKNNMLRLASVLLVAVLLSTCAISGVFAKYQSTGSNSDEAQVAKWGFKIAATDDNMFVANYDDSVIAANNTDKLVAPGTDEDWTPFSVSGKPEVDFTLTFEATVALTGDWENLEGGFYCPITVKVNGTSVDFTGVDSKDAWANAVKKAIDAVGKTDGVANVYNANTAPEDVTVPTITWDWAIGDPSTADTQLGDIAAGLVDGKQIPKISVSIAATATQAD